MVDGLNNLNNSLIKQLTQTSTSPASGASGSTQTADGASFKDLLMKNLGEVNKLQQDADQSLENYVTGKTNNVGEVISASQKASLAFNMLVQIRGKLQDAYDEVKNLRV